MTAQDAALSGSGPSGPSAPAEPGATPDPPGSAGIFPRFKLTTVLAVVPVFGYAYAYLYRLGQADRFGVPRELIHLDLTDVIVATFALVGAMTLLVGLANALDLFPTSLDHMSDTTRVVYRLCIPGVILAVLPMPFEYLYRVPIEYFFILPVVLFLVVSAFPLIHVRKQSGTAAERIDAARARSAGNSPDTGLVRRIGSEWLRLVFAILYVAALYYAVGSSQALYQTRFWVTTGPHPKALLASYGDTRVFAPFDPKRGELGRNRELLTEPLTLRSERVGQLRVPD